MSADALAAAAGLILAVALARHSLRRTLPRDPRTDLSRSRHPSRLTDGRPQ